MTQLFKNNAVSALVGAIAVADTVFNVANGELFPAPAAGEFFLITLIRLDTNGNESGWEIVKVTARTGNTLTVVRAQEGTTDQSWPDGTLVDARLTAGSLAELEAADARKLGGVTPSQDALAHLGASGTFSFRNKIINGKMEISQRGTSFAPPTGYTLDRWAYDTGVSTAVVGISKSTDTPPGAEFTNSLRLTVTTAYSSIANNAYAGIRQVVEGYNAVDLRAGAFTLSFWVKSSKVGVHSVGFGNGVDRNYAAQYTVTAANTWEKKTVTVPTPPAGNWDSANGLGMRIYFTLMAGSDFIAPSKNTWSTKLYAVGITNQVNCLDTVGNVFAITGVQLEAGEVATPFEHRPYGLELSLCQRYYEAVTTGGFWLSGVSCTTIYKEVPFTPKRASPTIMMPSALNGCWAGLGNDVTPQTWSPSSISHTAFSINAYHPNGIAGIKANTYRIDAEI